MKPVTPEAMPHEPDRSDCRDLLTAVFGLASPEVGQVEWLLDRIEGRIEGRIAGRLRGRTWA